MAEHPAMPLWTDAYIGDTNHLSTIEHGAYLLLLICMWRNGGSLPSDDRILARYAKLTAGQWKRIKPMLMPFFKVQDGSITQGRLTDEINAVRQHSKSQSRKAKARWLKTKEQNDAPVEPRESRTDASLSLTPNPVDDGGGNARAREADPPSEIPKTILPDNPPEPTKRERLLAAMGCDITGLTGPNGNRIGTSADMSLAYQWITKLNLTFEEVLSVIEDTMRRKSEPGPPSTFSYFNKPMQRYAGERDNPPNLTPIVPIRGETINGHAGHDHHGPNFAGRPPSRQVEASAGLAASFQRSIHRLGRGDAGDGGGS